MSKPRHEQNGSIAGLKTQRSRSSSLQCASITVGPNCMHTEIFALILLADRSQSPCRMKITIHAHRTHHSTQENLLLKGRRSHSPSHIPSFRYLRTPSAQEPYFAVHESSTPFPHNIPILCRKENREPLGTNPAYLDCQRAAQDPGHDTHTPT